MHKFISSIIFNHCTINHFECSGGKSRSLDLFSRRTVGWAMDKHSDRHLIINALLMAIWQRQPKGEVLVHSDQGSQYASADYLAFMREHNLIPSMSRRGNCQDERP
jgi:putative transposase